MKFRLFAIIISLMLLVFGAVTISANYANDDTVVPPVAEIELLLTGLLPVFEDFYGYDLVTDLARSGFSLTNFARQLHNYLSFLYDADILDEQDFSTYSNYWLFYFLDGIVMEMSESDVSHWGNVSLKGLVLNNIYVDALGLDFLGWFFSHNSIAYLAENLEIAAYFDFLIRDSSIAAILPFGAAVRGFLENDESDGLIAVIGMENFAALGQMNPDTRMNFFAGLLIDRMAPNLDVVIEEYENFIVIPSPGVVVSVNVSRDALGRSRELAFFNDTAFEINTDIGDANIDISFYNTGNNDFFMTLQTYDYDGYWHIFVSDLVPAGDLHSHLFPPHANLGDIIRITVYSLDGEAVSGEFVIEIQ